MQRQGRATRYDDTGVSRRVRNDRQRLRAQGERPIQLWVADNRALASLRQHRQAAPVAASDHAAEDQAFIDAVSLDDE